MMVRVNLLKESEYRYQGAVSSLFIVRTSMATLIAFSAVFVLMGVTRYRTARADLAACREIWRMREPMYNQVLAMKQDLATFKKQQQELAGWGLSRINWYDPLLELQAIVPPSLQLKRLNVRGEMELGRRVVEADAEGGPAKAAAAATGITPSRQFFISLDGKALGKMAEDVVVQFVRTLDSSRKIKPLLQTIKLQSLQRDTSASGKEASRTFTIEATTRKRDLIMVMTPAPPGTPAEAAAK